MFKVIGVNESNDGQDFIIAELETRVESWEALREAELQAIQIEAF